MTSLTVDIKVLHNDIQRRFSLGTQAPTWNTLAKQIHNRFVLPEDYNLALGYLDEDGETVVISSTKELAEVWPVVTEDDERDLDSLPPLRFTIVHLPGLPVPSDSAERDGTPTLGGSASMSPDRDAEPDARDSGESKPAAFRDDLRAFIDAVKSVIDGDDKIKSALDKLVQHNGKQPTGGEDRDERDDFIIVAEEIERFAERGADKRENALSAGIITALLLPAFADAHPPPPPHHPPQHGRPHHDPFPHPPGPHHGHPGHGPTHGHPHGPPPPPPHGRHPGPPGGHHGRGSHGRKHPHGPPGPPPHPKHGDHPFPPYGFGRHPFGMMPHWGHACPRKRCACAAGLGDESSASSDSDSSDSEASDSDAEDPHFGFFGHRPYGFSRPHTGIERFPWPGPAHGPGGSARTSFHGHDRHGPAHGPFPDHGPGHKSRRGPPGPPHGRGRHGGRGGPSHPPPPPPGPAPSHGHPGHHAPHGGPPQHYPRPGGRHDRPGKWGWGWAA